MSTIKRRSMFSGKTHVHFIPEVSQEQVEAWLSLRKAGLAPLIQESFPHLSADDREFILTGATPEEWEAMTANDREVILKKGKHDALE